MKKAYGIYREWVYKVFFYLLAQIAALIAMMISGDFVKVWQDIEFDITIEEVKTEG